MSWSCCDKICMIKHVLPRLIYSPGVYLSNGLYNLHEEVLQWEYLLSLYGFIISFMNYCSDWQEAQHV